MEDAWTRKLLLGGFEAGESPLLWHDALGCVSVAPYSLQGYLAPWPFSQSMMQGIYSRLGSNSIQVCIYM